MLLSIKPILIFFLCQILISGDVRQDIVDPAVNMDPLYYVVVAYENGYNKPGQPVVSNVVYANCKFHNSTMISNQLNTYYSAFYSKARGHTGLVSSVAFSFKTRDEAEALRREQIANLNRNWEPLLIQKFSVLCEGN